MSVAGFRRYNICVFHVGNVNQNGGDGRLRSRNLFSGFVESTGLFHCYGWVSNEINSINFIIIIIIKVMITVKELCRFL